MGLAVYDADGTKLFERMYGDFSPDRRVAIASASKLVSGVTLFRLIDAGYLSLDSTTGGVLGWTGTKGEITLRHLLYKADAVPADATAATFRVGWLRVPSSESTLSAERSAST